MLSPTNLPIIFWPLTLSVNRPVGIVCKNPSWSAVSETDQCHVVSPSNLLVLPFGCQCRNWPIGCGCTWTGVPDEEAGECLDSWGWVICATYLPYVNITLASSCLKGDVSQQGHEFTVVAAWGPCLAAVIGVTYSKSDWFFIYFLFFLFIGQRNELTHAQKRTAAHIPVSHSITRLSRRPFSLRISQHKQTLCLCEVGCNPWRPLSRCSTKTRSNERMLSLPGLFLVNITQL